MWTARAPPGKMARASSTASCFSSSARTKRPAGFRSAPVLKYAPYWDRVKTPLWRQTRASHSASRPVQPRAASAARWLARSWTGGARDGARHPGTSARSRRTSWRRVPLGLTIIRSGSGGGTHGQGRARVPRSRRRRGADLWTPCGRVCGGQLGVFLRDRLFVLADLAQQGVRHVLRLGGGLVDFLRVVFQRREPALHVRRATAPVVADADPHAGQHRREFGAEFFAGILHATEIPDAVRERGTVQPIGVAGGMPEFVQHGLVIPVRGCELVTFGKGDAVGLEVVERAIAAHVPHVHAALHDDALGELMRLPLGPCGAVVVAPLQRQAVSLFDVEHVVDPYHRRTGLLVVLLAAGRLVRVGRAGRLLRLPLVVHRVTQDGRRLLAWADVTTQRLDLGGGRPAVVAVALRGLSDTQVQRVHAPVRLPAYEVFRESARAGPPRLLPRRHALLDLLLDGRDKGRVVVLHVPRAGLRRRSTPPSHQLPPSHGTASAPGRSGPSPYARHESVIRNCKVIVHWWSW